MYLVEQLSCRHLSEDPVCPYSDRTTDICSASLSSLFVGSHRKRQFCLSEDYDTCPLFLAKMMRKR